MEIYAYHTSTLGAYCDLMLLSHSKSSALDIIDVFRTSGVFPVT